LPPAVSVYTEVGDALKRVKGRLRGARKVESIQTLHSYGRVLSQDIIAPVDVPQASTSHMDGFAVRSKDLRGASATTPAVLRIVAASGPGERASHAVGPGEAVQVATGALLPDNADTVVPVESAGVRGNKLHAVEVQEPGRHVYEAGRDIHRGEVVLSKGHTIRAQDVGILISLGFLRVLVWEKPRVAVVATGSELTPATNAKKGKILESHSPVFLGLAKALGCDVQDFGVVGDNSEKLAEVLRKALSSSDFVLTLGGTSAGKRDLVVSTVSNLHPDVLVHGLKLDRGRVTGLAAVKGKPILMLPGPIQAASNAFLIVGIPLIEELSGSGGTGLVVPCVVGAAWEARRKFSDFQKVVYVRLRPGAQPVAEPISGETESMKLLADADGFFVVPENTMRLDAGDRVEVRLIPGFSFA